MEHFGFGSPEWAVLLNVELPTDLAPTGDLLLEDAAERLETLPPDFNLPLRRRLAVARKIC